MQPLLVFRMKLLLFRPYYQKYRSNKNGKEYACHSRLFCCLSHSYIFSHIKKQEMDAAVYYCSDQKQQGIFQFFTHKYKV